MGAVDMKQTTSESRAQRFLREMFVGTLIYAVVLGFFNDYTDILDTTSYSVTFALAFVMQVLTYLTLLLKKWVVGRFKTLDGPAARVGVVLAVWAIMFFSKFVFLAVIDAVFTSEVEVSGFVGLMIVIVVMMVVQKMADVVYAKLA